LNELNIPLQFVIFVEQNIATFEILSKGGNESLPLRLKPNNQ